MAEPPSKNKKHSRGDYTIGVLMQVVKIKRWLGKECPTETHP